MLELVPADVPAEVPTEAPTWFLVSNITRFLPQVTIDEWPTLTMRQPTAQVAPAPS